MFMSFACLSFQICAKLNVFIWRGTFLYKRCMIRTWCGLQKWPLEWKSDPLYTITLSWYWRWQALIVSSASHWFIIFFYCCWIRAILENILKRLHRWCCQCQISAIEPVWTFLYSISFLYTLGYIRNERKRSMWSINGLRLRFWNWINTVKHTIVQLYLYSTVVKLVILYDSTCTVCVSTK